MPTRDQAPTAMNLHGRGQVHPLIPIRPVGIHLPVRTHGSDQGVLVHLELVQGMSSMVVGLPPMIGL